MIEMKELNTSVTHDFSFGNENLPDKSTDNVGAEEVDDDNTQQISTSEPTDQLLNDAWVHMITEIQKSGTKSDSYADKSLAAAHDMFRIAHDNSGNINLQRGIAHVLNQEAQSIREEREVDELEYSTEK